MKREQVLRILKDNKTALAERYGIASLFLFGSTARDEAGTASDVDLLVEFSRPIGLFEFVALRQQLESLLGCPVDLGTRRSLKPHLSEEVMREIIHVA